MVKRMERGSSHWYVYRADGHRIDMEDVIVLGGVVAALDRSDEGRAGWSPESHRLWRALPGWRPSRPDELFTYDEEG